MSVLEKPWPDLKHIGPRVVSQERGRPSPSKSTLAFTSTLTWARSMW